MDYKKFYEKTEEYFRNVAKNEHGLTDQQIEEYMTPTLTLKDETGNRDMSFLFRRLSYHLQNQSITRNVIKFDANYGKLKNLICGFDVAAFLNKYASEDEFYEEFIKVFPQSSNTVNISQSKRCIYSKGVYSAAKMLKRFNSYDDFIDKLKKYDDFAPEYLSLNVIGFGSALPCDFLKELDSDFDVCKPDVHVKTCIKELTKIPDSIKGARFDYDVRVKVHEIAEEASKKSNDPSMTTFKLDKMIFLICSNVFYKTEDKNNTSPMYRENYIKYMKEELHI